MWSARERTIICKNETVPGRGKKYKGGILKNWKLCAQMTWMWILSASLKKQEMKMGCAIFGTFSTDGPSEFLVVCSTRWDKHQRRLERTVAAKIRLLHASGWTVASGPGRAESWMEPVGKKGYGEQWKITWKNVPIQKWTWRPWSAFMEQENWEDISPRYVLKYSTRGGSNIVQLFDTAEKKDHFVVSRRRWLECQGKKVDLQESWQDEWHDIGYQGTT